MTILEANLRVLTERHPEAAAAVSDSGRHDRRADGDVHVGPSRAGPPTCLYNGVSLHSGFDPVREARRLIEGECGDDNSLAIFFGFGLGYYPEAFLRRYPGKPALVIEPGVEFFQRSLSSRPMQEILGHPGLRLCVGCPPESIIAHLDRLPLSCIGIIKPRSLFVINRTYYRRAEGVIATYLARKKLNLNTLKRFGRLWVRNLVRNVGLLSAPGVRHLVGRFAGLPALVLASGPSLDRIRPLLADIRSRMLIVSVDTSLRACAAAGVEPDFVVVVDPQYWNTRHLDGISIRNSVLLSESSTHPRVFRVLRLPTFFGSSFFPLGRFFETILGEKGTLGAGGSVATSAWDLVRQLGCTPIFMGGLDLGFPAKATHFQGATFESRFASSSGRLTPSETLSFSYLHDANPFQTASNSEGAVMTDQRMMIYKWWFEDQMKAYPAARTRNLSAGGVRIDGMPYFEPKALLDLPIRRDEIELGMREVKRINEKEIVQTGAIRRAVGVLIGELSDLAALSAEGLKEVDEFERLLEGNLDTVSCGEALERIDSRLLSAGSRGIVSFLLQPLITEILNEGRESRGEVLRASRDLYRQIGESAAYHLALFHRHLDQPDNPDLPA